MDESLISKLASIAAKQIQVAQQFKLPRITEIQKSEDMYMNKVKKQLKGRFNIPLPILSGFVDTLKSKIDDVPTLNFKRKAEEDLKAARKVSALWNSDSGDDQGEWGFVDRQVKFLAIFSGRGIFKYYAESDPEYKSNLEWLDYYDFLCEPQGGANLKRHLFCGQQNIFRTKSELLEGAKTGLYNRVGVINLINKTSDGDINKNQEEAERKFNRFQGLGLDPISNNYVGEDIYNLTEWYLIHKGVKYYLFFDPKTLRVARADELKNVFSDNEHPFVSWATHEDPANFWSKAPVDDIRPVADAMRIIFNEALNNIQKRNWGMRAFDKNIFPNPEQLQWKLDGLVKATPKPGQAIGNGIYSFETPDNSTITVNLVEFLDNMLGQKSGITAGAQGASDKDQKVGVYYGDLQQVADRLGLYNKAYKESWAKLGKKYITGLKDHLNEAKAIEMIGNDGIEWDEIKKEDIKTFDIEVTGGNLEKQQNDIKKGRQSQAITAIAANPALTQKINQNWLIENILRSGDFDEEEIRRARDAENDGDQEIMSEAAKSIQLILKGKKPDLNRGATTGFIQKIIDFATDKLDKKNMDKYDILMDYAMAHKNIAQENMMRKAMVIKSMGNPAEVGGAAPAAIPGQGAGAPSGTSGGTISISQRQSRQLSPITV